jgi:hypothetical protein
MTKDNSESWHNALSEWNKYYIEMQEKRNEIIQMTDECIETWKIPNPLPEWFTERMFQKIIDLDNQKLSDREAAAQMATIKTEEWEILSPKFKKFDITHDEITAIAKYLWIKQWMPKEWVFWQLEMLRCITVFGSIKETITWNDLKDVPYLQEIFAEDWEREKLWVVLYNIKKCTDPIRNFVNSILSKLFVDPILFTSENQEIYSTLSQTQEDGEDNIYNVRITSSWKIMKVISNKYQNLASKPGFHVNATWTRCEIYPPQANITVLKVYKNYLSWVKELLASKELPHNIEELKQRIFEEVWLEVDIFDFKGSKPITIEGVTVASYEMKFKEWLTKQNLEKAVDKALRYQLVPGWEDGKWELAISKEDYIQMLEEIFWKLDN